MVKACKSSVQNFSTANFTGAKLSKIMRLFPVYFSIFSYVSSEKYMSTLAYTKALLHTDNLFVL